MKVNNILFFGVLINMTLLSFILAPPLCADESIFDEMDKEIEETKLEGGRMDAETFQESQDAMRNNFIRNMTEQNEEWGKLNQEMQAQWEEMVERVNAQRQELKKRVEQQWDTFHDSSNKEWVEYDDDMDTRSIVDFENGEIEFATLIPFKESEASEEPEPTRLDKKQENVKELAKDKIKKQIKKVLSKDNEIHTEALKDQIKDPEGKSVSRENSDKYVDKYVSPEIKVEDKPVIGKDGVPRMKAKVKIKMVPEHLRIRAEKYKELVDEYADKYDLDPSLIYAVIHTESYFNPLAKSYIPAFGLMQLVPKSGAMDAYYYLNKVKKILSSEYLYDPDNNIMLGATYLHILLHIYFDAINKQPNKQTLCVAAYNWGTGRIKRNIVNKYDVDKLSNEEIVQIINEVAPKETRDYVERVNRRMELYKQM